MVYLAQAVSDQRKSVELLGVVTVVPAYKRKILSQREMLRHSEDTSLEIRKTLSMKCSPDTQFTTLRLVNHSKARTSLIVDGGCAWMRSEDREGECLVDTG